MNHFVVGLTGGIGSGKSAAALRFGDLGASLVDADIIARQLTDENGSGLALPLIRQAFGEEVFASDGSFDRSAMRQKAFADPIQRQLLESILHPLIRQQCQSMLAEVDGCYAMLVVPLLIESPAYRDRCDRILVVDCPESVQIQRVMARNALSESEVRDIMATQINRHQRLAAADDVIDNSGALELLHYQVDVLHEQYLRYAWNKVKQS